MENSNNNNWMAENPLFKNKDQRYYYDFGTGNKIERQDVKEKRDAFLGSTSKPTNQKKDDFLEGFNDLYGEKREQGRKERFADIRANADKRNLHSLHKPTHFLKGLIRIKGQIKMFGHIRTMNKVFLYYYIGCMAEVKIIFKKTVFGETI